MADNCSLTAKNDFHQKAYQSTKQIPSDAMGNPEFEEEEKEIKVGQSIVLKSGPLKGYQGIVKSITR